MEEDGEDKLKDKDMRKILYIFGVVLCISACSSKPKELTDAEKIEQGIVGDYVYLDRTGTLHADRTCLKIDDFLSEESRSSALRRVPLNELTKKMLDNSCNRCINDVMFENLKQICVNNGNYVDEYATDSVAADSVVTEW